MSDRDSVDPRLAFYLEHKDQIDEWLKLPDLERQEADVFYRMLADPLEERSLDLPGSPEYYRELDSDWRKLFFLLPDWSHPDQVVPLVGIGLEWNPKHHGFGQINVGIRVEIQVPDAKVLRDSLTSAISLPGFKKNPHWSAQKSVPPSKSQYWEDLDTYADEIIDGAVDLWDKTWETADQIFRKWAAENRNA